MPVLTKKTTAVNHPLNFMDVYSDIAIELPHQPNIGIVRAEINKVIRRINDEIGLWRELVRVSAGTITTGWQTLDVDNWNDEDNQTWDLWGKFAHGWNYDPTDFILRLSDVVVEVEEVYLDSVEWTCVSLPEVKDSNNSNEEIFAQIGRYLYFPIDLATSTKVVDIRVNMSYSFVQSNVEEGTNIDLPEAYRQMLVSGTLFALTNRGKYKDPDVFAVNKEIFEREHESLRRQYINLEAEYVRHNMIYKY
tara:strand:+ start:109 stop:855 length:747 start_codon:yes stop_codon:yes gene_type:complete